jgi:release factor glutamine methyltransferase
MSVAEALHRIAPRLAAAGVQQARTEARLLVAHATGLAQEAIIGHPERLLDDAAQVRLAELVERRAGREPFAQIVGVREFWSLPFKVTADTLTPRPDSETLIEAALDGVDDPAAPLRVLDLGTGTGCLLLALLSAMPRSTGLGIDLSEAAVAVARQNAAALGLAGRATFSTGDWMDAVDERFNLVITNPPYIETGVIDRLEPEVSRYEPRLALDGGLDGLQSYRAIASGLDRVLAEHGIAVMEVGAGQAQAVCRILAEAGFAEPLQRADLAGTTRCLIAARNDGGTQKRVGNLCASV